MVYQFFHLLLVEFLERFRLALSHLFPVPIKNSTKTLRRCFVCTEFRRRFRQVNILCLDCVLHEDQKPTLLMEGEDIGRGLWCQFWGLKVYHSPPVNEGLHTADVARDGYGFHFSHGIRRAGRPLCLTLDSQQLRPSHSFSCTHLTSE